MLLCCAEFVTSLSNPCSGTPYSIIEGYIQQQGEELLLLEGKHLAYKSENCQLTNGVKFNVFQLPLYKSSAVSYLNSTLFGNTQIKLITGLDYRYDDNDILPLILNDETFLDYHIPYISAFARLESKETWNQSLYYTAPAPTTELMALLQYVLKNLFVRRLGFMYFNDTSSGAAEYDLFVEQIKRLNKQNSADNSNNNNNNNDPITSYTYVQASNAAFNSSVFTEFMSHEPQAVFIFGTQCNHTGEFFRSLITGSSSNSNNSNNNITLLIPHSLMLYTSTLYTHASNNNNNNDDKEGSNTTLLPPENIIYSVTSPLANDDFTAMKEFNAELNYTVQNNDDGVCNHNASQIELSYCVRGWLTGKLIMDLLNKYMNFSRQDVLNALFEQNRYVVGKDMYFGAYGGECDWQSKAQGAICECNEGGRYVALAQLGRIDKTTNHKLYNNNNNDKDDQPLPQYDVHSLPEDNFTFPHNVCNAYNVQLHTIMNVLGVDMTNDITASRWFNESFATFNDEQEQRNSASTTSSSYQQQQQQQPFTQISSQNLIVIDNVTITSNTSNEVDTIRHDKLISYLTGPLPNNINITDNLVIVDPLFLNTSLMKHDPHYLYFMPTLEQEWFTVSQQLSNLFPPHPHPTNTTTTTIMSDVTYSTLLDHNNNNVDHHYDYDEHSYDKQHASLHSMECSQSTRDMKRHQELKETETSSSSASSFTLPPSTDNSTLHIYAIVRNVSTFINTISTSTSTARVTNKKSETRNDNEGATSTNNNTYAESMLTLVNRSVAAFGYVLSGNRTVSDNDNSNDNKNNMTWTLKDLIESVTSITFNYATSQTKLNDMTSEAVNKSIVVFMVGFKENELNDLVQYLQNNNEIIDNTNNVHYNIYVVLPFMEVMRYYKTFYDTLLLFKTSSVLDHILFATNLPHWIYNNNSSNSNNNNNEEVDDSSSSITSKKKMINTIHSSNTRGNTLLADYANVCKHHLNNEESCFNPTSFTNYIQRRFINSLVGSTPIFSSELLLKTLYTGNVKSLEDMNFGPFCYNNSDSYHKCTIDSDVLSSDNDNNNEYDNDLSSTLMNYGARDISV